MSVIRLDGHPVDVLNAECEFRPCFALGFDKGSFTPGVGYTSYHAKERRVCWTRHLNGCPHVGVHLTCGGCHKPLALVMEGEERVKPDACPFCGSVDLYWLADVVPAPLPCCESPDVPKVRAGKPVPYKQKCRSCGAMLRGARLEIARAASRPAADTAPKDKS